MEWSGVGREGARRFRPGRGAAKVPMAEQGFGGARKRVCRCKKQLQLRVRGGQIRATA